MRLNQNKILLLIVVCIIILILIFDFNLLESLPIWLKLVLVLAVFIVFGVLIAKDEEMEHKKMFKHYKWWGTKKDKS